MNSRQVAVPIPTHPRFQERGSLESRLHRGRFGHRLLGITASVRPPRDALNNYPDSCSEHPSMLSRPRILQIWRLLLTKAEIWESVLRSPHRGGALGLMEDEHLRVLGAVKPP